MKKKKKKKEISVPGLSVQKKTSRQKTKFLSRWLLVDKPSYGQTHTSHEN